ncbi:MAG: glycoside hydrolase family 15 protein, partial [Myxococcaceae bacterium]
MALRLEDYALIGDMQSAALVGNNGSIDWLCWPRFDSDACFAALLGSQDNGRWLVAPAGGVRKVSRQYRNRSLVLETTFETEDGVVRLIDFMPVRGSEPDLVRIVEGVSGRVPMRMELRARFGYGSRKPWVRRFNGDRTQMAGPEMLQLHTDVPITDVEADGWTADFSVEAGQRIPFLLAWHHSYHEPAPPISPLPALEETEAWWREWSAQSKRACVGPFREEMRSSLRVLKALTYSPTGGMVAAPTASLPEAPGGVRNWDYRFCW